MTLAALLHIKQVIDRLKQLKHTPLTQREQEAVQECLSQAYDRAAFLLGMAAPPESHNRSAEPAPHAADSPIVGNTAPTMAAACKERQSRMDHFFLFVASEQRAYHSPCPLTRHPEREPALSAACEP